MEIRESCGVSTVCGIFGYVGRDESPGGLQKRAKSLSHRGPDGFGEFSDTAAGVYFAHCRLAIIDLSSNGAQPMPNEDESVWVTFNGEIYNFPSLRNELVRLGHRFKSNSDTEVLVHGFEEWGESLPSRLEGIFAFALFDRVKQQIFICRDRTGVKPLYYVRDKLFFAFASEPKALLDLGGKRAVSSQGLADYLLLGYSTGEQSIWEGIKRLPPGETLSLDTRSLASVRKRYWSLETNKRISTKEAEELLEGILQTAVESNLLSDVPVGLFLSGGIDSGLVAKMAAKANHSLRAVTVEFEDWDKNETERAKAVADHAELNLAVCRISRKDMQDLDPVFDLFDEPLADTAIFSTNAVCKKIREHSKVALSGDGGDELFGGYSWYQLFRFNWKRRLAFTVERFRRMLGVGRVWPEGCDSPFEYFRLITAPGLHETTIKALFPQVQELNLRETRSRFERLSKSSSGSDGTEWLVHDFHTYLVDCNLARMDRISMGLGLEVRVPFLERAVVELAFQLPNQLRVGSSENKPALRQIGRRLLPAQVASAAKQGFSCPLEGLWSTSVMIEEIRNGSLGKIPRMNESVLNRYLEQPQVGTWWFGLWQLAALNRWAKRWL